MAERLRRGVDAGDAAELGGEGVAGEVHVEPVSDAAADEPAACSWRYHQRWTACGLGRFFG